MFVGMGETFCGGLSVLTLCICLAASNLYLFLSQNLTHV